MTSQNEVVSFLDFLDFDEEVIDLKLKSIMDRNSHTEKHLRNAIHMLQYKNLVNLQLCYDCENDEECRFVAKLLRDLSEENVENVCTITNIVLGLDRSSLVSNSEHLLQQLLANIEFPAQGSKCTDTEEANSSNELLILKVCDSILDAVISNNEKLSLPFLETPLENILSSSDDKLKVYFLNNTVPRLFQGIHGYNILDRIWNYLKQSKGETINNELKILSCLAEFYLPVADSTNSVRFESQIVFYYDFWSMLHNGLMSNDPAERKISTYLIKRAIDSLMALKKDLQVSLGDKILFNWLHKDVKIFKEQWDNFFILIDSLEEKQSNIVLPSLKLFEKLTSIESCWLNCAFNIGLKHDNAQVRLKCVEPRLKTKLENLSDTVILLEALNDINLYDQAKDCEELKTKITEAFKDRNTLILILRAIPMVKWSPVPFYHISKLLAEENTDLSSIDPTQISQIVIDILKVPCNNIPIRHAVKVNITDFIAHCCKNLHWKDLISIYSLVKWHKYSAESKNNNAFFALIKGLEFNKDEKEKFLKFISDSHKNIEFGLLYLKNHEKDIDIFMDILSKKVLNIQEINNRQYSNKMECLNNAVFVTHLLRITITTTTLTNILTIKMVAQYILDLLSSDSTLSLDEINLIFIGFLGVMSAEDIKDILLQMYKVSILFLKDKETKLDKKIFSIYVIDAISNKLDAHYKHEMLTIKQILYLIKNIKFNESQNVDDVGRLRNAFYEKSCEIVFKNLQTTNSDESHLIIKKNLREIVDFVEDIIECGGYGCLKWILKITNKILPEILNDEQSKFNLNQYIGRMWKEIEELKSNNQYSPCIEQFVKLITQDGLLKKAMYNNIIILYCSKIVEYGSLKTSPLFYLVDELNKKDINEDYGQIIYVLCDILLFAPVPKKDQRIADNVAVELLQDPKFTLDNKDMNYFNFTIQYSVILTLSKIKHPKIFETIASLIINKIDDHFRTKQRYHGNSQSQRLLLIGLQHLLLLSLFNLEILKSEKVKWVIELCGRLPHQPSVRICLEWYIALHYYVMGKKIDAKIVEILKSNKIPIASQFMILYSTLKHKIANKSYTEEELEFVMDNLLSNTMGQMFNVRLHAQYLATKLYKMVEKSDKYAYIIDVIQKTFVESAKDKNFVKLQEDFFVQDFDIVEHLTPSFIYYFLPRYCDIGANENVDEKFIRNVTTNVNDIICEMDGNDNFKKKWRALHKSDEEVFKLDFRRSVDGSKDPENAETGTIQKKYVPWKNMSDIEVYDSGKKKQSSSELIVVASLIDKLPNLGGMARTSEVFGVKTYVVDSLRHLQDKQFQGLSVSAEHWVNIEEVRPGQPLKDYLMRKKTEGYSVVAAEQTSTSYQLQRFKFPKKTLLLLGHEKEGIPCDLLPMMDHCVEIPQQGFVRSLNVHVTAAIFVWEYSRQNIL